MEDLKARIKALMTEIESTHLKKDWIERLIEAGIEKEAAYTWAAEIGHVIDEYRSTLMGLADVLAETDVDRIPRQVHSWAVGISEVTVAEIEEPMRYLEKQLDEFLPPEPDDEDEPS